jgi:hypothetical protein
MKTNNKKLIITTIISIFLALNACENKNINRIIAHRLQMQINIKNIFAKYKTYRSKIIFVEQDFKKKTSQENVNYKPLYRNWNGHSTQFKTYQENLTKDVETLKNDVKVYFEKLKEAEKEIQSKKLSKLESDSNQILQKKWENTFLNIQKNVTTKFNLITQESEDIERLFASAALKNKGGNVIIALENYFEKLHEICYHIEIFGKEIDILFALNNDNSTLILISNSISAIKMKDAKTKKIPKTKPKKDSLNKQVEPIKQEKDTNKTK